MTTSEPARRSSVASALILVAVLLLFGAATFVAGLAIGGGGSGIGLADQSASASEGPDLTPGPTPILQTITCAEPSEAFAVLCETYAEIKSQYVDEITDEALVDAAVRGMVEYGLTDPYSGYLTPDQYESAQDDLSGEFSGIGAEVGMENLEDPDDLEACTVVSATCAMVIVSPLEGSPAEEAGLRPGDQVLAIDGAPTTGESVSSLVYVVRGEAGTDVTLTIQRDGETSDITVTRAVIDLNEVTYELLEDSTGYVRLTSFTDRAPDMIADAIADLLEPGSRCVRVRHAREPRRLHRCGAADRLGVRRIGRAAVHGRVRRGRPGMARRGRPGPGSGRPGRGARERGVGVGVGDRGGRAPGARARADRRASRPSARTRSRSGATCPTAAACGSRPTDGSLRTTTRSHPTASSPTWSSRRPMIRRAARTRSSIGRSRFSRRASRA